MRLPFFLLLLVLAAGGYAAIGVANGVATGTIILRVIIIAVALQVAYALLIVVAARLRPNQDRSVSSARWPARDAKDREG